MNEARRTNSRSDHSEREHKEAEEAGCSAIEAEGWGTCLFIEDGQPVSLPVAEAAAFTQKIVSERKVAQEYLLTAVDRAETIPGEAAAVRFVESLGLTAVPHLPVTEVSIPQIKEAFPEDAEDFEANTSHMGHYFSCFGVAATFPERAKESGLHPLQNLVHELAHGSAASNEVVCWDLSSEGWHCLASGFETHDPETDEWKGTFWEEGFAELIGATYRERALPDTLGPRMGLHEKYLVNDQGDCSVSALAATTIELLAAKEPRIVSAMLDARQDRRRMGELEHLVNELHPGLFTTLNECEDFRTGMLTVLKILHNDQDEVCALAPELAQTQTLFDDYIALQAQKASKH